MNVKPRNNFTVQLTNRIPLPSLDYINDMAKDKGFTFGRQFTSVPSVLEDLYYLYDQHNKTVSEFDVKKHLFSKELIEKEILFGPMNDSEESYYVYTLKFLTEIDYDAIPGLTPLDKALNTTMYLVHLSNETNGNSNRQSSEINVQNEQQLADAIKDVAQNGVNDGTVGTGSDDSGAECSKEMTKCVRDFLYDLSPSISHIFGATKPSDVKINREMLKTIKIKAYLEDTQGLETGLETSKERNNDSTERTNLQLEEYSQINKVKKQHLGMEHFDDKFIKKELMVKEKVKPKDRKQILYMLLDDSGSMNNIVKQTYVRAVLLNRLESVVDGKSELVFSLYESRKYMETEVKDKDEAKKLYQTISTKRPRGGGTNIGAVLQETIDQIHDKEGYVNPEIMIVCDGDDYVDPKQLDFKGVRINVVLLGTTNTGLQKIAKLTDGFCTIEKLYERGMY